MHTFSPIFYDNSLQISAFRLAIQRCLLRHSRIWRQTACSVPIGLPAPLPFCSLLWARSRPSGRYKQLSARVCRFLPEPSGRLTLFGKESADRSICFRRRAMGHHPAGRRIAAPCSNRFGLAARHPARLSFISCRSRNTGSGGRKSSTVYKISERASGARSDVVRATGLEPARLAAQDPKSCVSANSTTPAQCYYHSRFCGGIQSEICFPDTFFGR